MDWAIQMADDAVAEVIDEVVTDDMRRQIDDKIRPLVDALACKLHNEDWDCETEADAFDRFPQEMLGYDDARFAEWVRNELVYEKDPDRIAMLSGHLQKLAGATNGR
jgi:hypothetical protein